MLKVRDLVVAYGGIEALKGISIDVPEGQIVTLIGADPRHYVSTGRAAGVPQPDSAGEPAHRRLPAQR